jgi:hypothetical protein
MELDAARKGFDLHQKPNQGNIGRGMNVGDLVHLTRDGVVAAWYPGIDQGAAGIIIKLTDFDQYDEEAQKYPPDERKWATVEWPRGRDTHLLQDLEIINKYF